MSVTMYALMGLAALGGVSLLIARRMVRAVVGLLGSLVALAFIYFALGAEAAGAAQLLVYAGGMVVLLLFGVMTSGEAGQGLRLHWRGLLSGVGLAAAVGYGLVRSGLYALIPDQNNAALSLYTGGTLAGAGRTLIQDQMVAFEVLALLLLIVLVFATAFAKRADKLPGGPG